jgi:type I restriction enzyme M protein
MADKVLMLDARNIYRKVTRKVYDFTPEHLKNLTSIVWLYRGQNDKYLGLIKEYFGTLITEALLAGDQLKKFDDCYNSLKDSLNKFKRFTKDNSEFTKDQTELFSQSIADIAEITGYYQSASNNVLENIQGFKMAYTELPGTNLLQHEAKDSFKLISTGLRDISKQVDLLYKQMIRSIDIAEKDLGAKAYDEWDTRENNRLKKELDNLRKDTISQLKKPNYFFKQIEWLNDRFPDAVLVPVEGLVKIVDQSVLEANDWSLTPGRYVGVAPIVEDEDFNFEETIRDIHLELEGLNTESAELAKLIQRNFEELGI